MRNIVICILVNLFGLALLLEHRIIPEENCSGYHRTTRQINGTLSRKKRYLAFPTGSSFVVSTFVYLFVEILENEKFF